MSDKEKALAVLQLASQTCSGALAALADSATSTQPAGVSVDESLDARLKDFVSLLTLLYQNATKLAIALKPANLTYRAAFTPAKELALHTDALASCACSIDSTLYGGALVREVRGAAEEVLDALVALLGVYAADAQKSGSSDAQTPRDMYLVNTAAVHEAIERARGVSRSNLEAVKKRWESVLSRVDDCAKEAQEMIEEEEEESGDEEDNERDELALVDGDDDWGELDGVPSPRKEFVKASKEELARLQSFTYALLKRVSSVLLGPTSEFAFLSPSTLDGLLSRCDALSKTANDLVDALYVPQELETVTRQLATFSTLVNELRSTVSSLGLASLLTDGEDVADFSRQTVSLNIQPHITEAKFAKEKKWFNVCFAQIFKCADSIGEVSVVSEAQ
ncbi:hypothetical protein EW145_g1486 [Phellinidium pouzarii]|uniref:Cyclin-D1-binding protein 1-like N-terminal domain-containing protein n=1 Tax=Phellinidium pouzarii TaxID=167371 RepID=A0A4S4LE90_9AGAM|nr:hypothetical protein EW145_g1486 [Phellinidium pouzarii]